MGSPVAVAVGKVEFGGGGFVVIAGPCAVESERQILRTAEAVARAGAKILRGGAWKPRTSPYSFQGLGLEGLKLLAKARRETGLPFVTEVLTDTLVAQVAEYADMLQVGSRSMGNTALLEAVAAAGLPVLLKRGMAATVEEMAEAVRFLREHDNSQVVLCERGIRTFGTATRNTCDIAAVPLLQKLTGLPVIVDPSHATGVRELVIPVSRAAAAIDADGLIVEVHPDPDRAWSDAEQSLPLVLFQELMAEVVPLAQLRAGRRTAAASYN